MNEKQMKKDGYIYRAIPVFCLFVVLFPLQQYRKNIDSTLLWAILATMLVIMLYCLYKLKLPKQRLWTMGGFVALSAVIMGIFLYL